MEPAATLADFARLASFFGQAPTASRVRSRFSVERYGRAFALDFFADAEGTVAKISIFESPAVPHGSAGGPDAARARSASHTWSASVSRVTTRGGALGREWVVSAVAAEDGGAS